LIGEERVIASEQPGTTRDSILVPFARDGRNFLLVDTAGVRRRARVEDALERASIAKTLQAIAEAHVVIMILDAHDVIGEQDASVLGQALERGRVILIAVNKWDGVADAQREQIRRQLSLKLDFVPFAPLHFISARHGSGVGELARDAVRGYDAAMRQMPTPALTRTLERALQAHQPPLVRGRRIKLRYAHQGGRNPAAHRDPRQPDHCRAGGLSALSGERLSRCVRFVCNAGCGRVSHRCESLHATQGAGRRRRVGRRGRNNAGSTKARLSATPKCRCGPVTRPVAPTLPIIAPRCTALPGVHVDRRQMTVHRHQSCAVIDQHRVATEEIVTGVDDAAVGRRAYGACRGNGRCPCRNAAIARLVVEEASRAKGIGAHTIDRREQAQCRRRALIESGKWLSCRWACSRLDALQHPAPTGRPAFGRHA
jgi:small GTP-binding protein